MKTPVALIAIATWLMLVLPSPVPNANAQGGGINHCITLTNTANNSQCASTAFVQSMLGNSTNSSGAWTQWTPTISCTNSIAPTTSVALGRYKLVGNKTFIFQISIAVTTLGSCNGYPTFTYPPGITPSNAIVSGAPSAQWAIASGREVQCNGSTVEVTAQTTFAYFTYYNNAAPAASGCMVTATGAFETT